MSGNHSNMIPDILTVVYQSVRIIYSRAGRQAVIVPSPFADTGFRLRDAGIHWNFKYYDPGLGKS